MAKYKVLQRQILNYISTQIHHVSLFNQFGSKAPRLQSRGCMAPFNKQIFQQFCHSSDIDTHQKVLNKTYISDCESNYQSKRDDKNTGTEMIGADHSTKHVQSNFKNENKSVVSVTQTDDVDVYKTLERDIDITNLKPSLPTHASSLAAYVNHSQTLTNLVQLGVDLSQLERNKELANLVLRMDFENDVKPYLLFLNRIRIKTDDLAIVINKNPELFMESIDDIEVRVNYFESKRFTKNAIARIITKASKLLSMPTVEIDKRLGFIQKEFMLTGDEVRKVVTSYPVIGLWPVTKLSENKIVYQEFLGFPQWELKHLLLKRPKLMTAGKHALMDRFDFLHNTMGIPHSAILNWPDVLTTRHSKLKQRHGFLRLHGRHQYDPKKPNYVSLKDLVTRTDAEFCELVAKVPLQHYDDYLKTL